MRIVLAAVFLLSGAGIVADAADNPLSDAKAEYKPLMEAAEESYDAMEDAIEKRDATNAAQSAKELSERMSKIVEFWTSRNVTDAQEFATNVKAAADEVAAKAAASDFEGAQAAAERAEQNCKSCHDAHRKFGLGGWKIK